MKDIVTTWNYRILAKRIKDDVQYSIYEVYYEDDKPVAYTETSRTIYCFDSDISDPVKSIKWELDVMKIATDKPILDYDNFPNVYYPYYRKMKLISIRNCQKNENNKRSD